ncbi:dienelactone hydrolase family protein [Microvirga sp. 2MCAF38]|uniref:dienelactone hydrolase family protein n=1 Tax=Microvirga sp. 2MCAF38 TaxID=3232989 RepID=UPI003F9D21AF
MQQMRTRTVLVGSSRLPGTLTEPENCRGLVVFAHGSGSSRLSPRNTFVAEQLNSKGFATLLFDLLNEEEANDRRNVFDIPLLGGRVLEAVSWATDQPDLKVLRLGIFGASTGAAAALVAAAKAPDLVAAVVSRGGRPDLADRFLEGVRAPTLLIVGGDDQEVLELNRAAEQRMSCRKSLTIVPGASHLFEEPGTLAKVVSAASRWFDTHLARAGLDEATIQ